MVAERSFIVLLSPQVIRQDSKDADSPSNTTSNQIGKAFESTVQKIFKPVGMNSDISGRGDFQVKKESFSRIANLLNSTSSPVTDSISSEIIDLEAKTKAITLQPGGGNFAGIKLTKVTPAATFTTKNKGLRERNLNLLKILFSSGITNESQSTIVREAIENIDIKDPRELRDLADPAIEAALRLVTSNPKLKRKFLSKLISENAILLNKARNLTIQVTVTDTRNRTSVFAATFLKLKFTSTDLDVRKGKRPGTIDFFFTNKFEKRLLEEVRSDIEKESVLFFTKNANLITLKRNKNLAAQMRQLVKDIKSLKIKLGIPTGGSIPLGNILLANSIQEFKKVMGTASTKGKSSLNLVANRIELSASVRRSVRSKMPTGISKNRPPPVPNILTNRSGRFVRSIKAIADIRTRTINYFYDPLYTVHERTSRNPSRTIEKSITSLVRGTVAADFGIIKSN